MDYQLSMNNVFEDNAPNSGTQTDIAHGVLWILAKYVDYI